MDNRTAELIFERARILADRAMAILREEDPNCPASGHAFKYAYLVLRRPKRFLERFGVGSLTIDPEEVAGFMWQVRDVLPGPREMMTEEIETIEEHNREAEAYVRSQARPSLHAVR